MPGKKKTWQEKLADDKGLPKIGRIEGKMSKRWGEGTMVIPAPREVNALMKKVRKGKLMTIDELRTQLCAVHKTDVACPITTGIFAWISAHAANEAEEEGKSRITPYWRTLKSKGELNPKYPGGISNIRKRLEAEGHTIVKKGGRCFVLELESKLQKY